VNGRESLRRGCSAGKQKTNQLVFERFVLFEILSSGSFAASQGRVKGTSGILVLVTAADRGLAGFAPLGTVLDNPIRQGAFKADIPTGFFGFDPFMFEDLFAFRLEFPIERGVPE